MSTAPKFSNRGHILAAVGSAVGIANLVLFPARVFNYGGLAFILVFVVCTFVLGVPLMIAETALGKCAQSDAVNAYGSIGGPRWRWAGYFGIVTSTLILSFYLVVAGWALYYFYLYAFQYDVLGGAVRGQGIGGLFGGFVTSVPRVLLFTGLFLGVTVVIVGNDIKRGIEAVSKSFVPLLVLLMVVLIVALQFIEGAALDYGNFRFDAAALFRIDDSGRIGILEAIGQAFFSLSLGACGMITYGAHLRKDTNVVANTHFVVHTDTTVALLGGLLVIPLFASADKLGLDPTLVFINLVEVFQRFGEPWSRLVGISFFLLFNLAILTSTMALLETPVSYLSDGSKGSRRKYALACGAGIFLLSVPAVVSFSPTAPAFLTNFLNYGGSTPTMGYFNFIIDFFGTFCILAGGLLLAFFLRRKWGLGAFFAELENDGYQPSRGLRSFLEFTFRWVIPLLMLVVFGGELIKVGYKLGLL